MTNPPRTSESEASWRPIAAAAVAAAIALTSLAAQLTPLAQMTGPLRPMTSASAVCTLVAAAALALHALAPAHWAPAAARALAAGLTFTGAAMLAAHLAARYPAQRPSSLGPSTTVPASVTVALLGVALLLTGLDSPRWRRLARWAAGGVLAISFAEFVGYAYDAEAFYTVGAVSSMPFPCALAAASLALGVLAVRPERGTLAAELHCEGASGTMARMLLPVAIIVPVVLGWMRLGGQKAGWYDTGVGTSLLVTAVVALLVLVIARSAHVLYALDRDRDVAAARVQATLESISDAFFSLDRQWRFTYLNRRAEALLEQPRGSLLGRRLGEAFPELVDSDLQREYEGALLSGRSVAFTQFFGTLDRWLDVHAYPSADGLSVYFHDITAAKRDEARLRRLLDTNLIGVYFWDLDGRIVDANDTFLRIVGYSREDLEAGRLDWTAMTPPEYRALDATAVGHVLATGLLPQFEKEYIRKDGSRVAVLLGGGALDERRRTGVSFALDVTERRRAEAALHESEAWLRLVLEATSTGLWDWDLGSGRVTWSDSNARLFGLEPGEFRGTFDAVLERIHPDDRAVVQARVARALEEGQQLALEFRAFGPRNELRQVGVRGRVLRGTTGQPVRVFGVTYDVTERWRAADRLRRAFTLARASAWEWDVVSDLFTLSEDQEAMFGQPPGGIRRLRDLEATVHPDDRARVREAFTRALDESDAHEIEFRTLWPDGTTRWLRSQGRVTRDAQGRPIRIGGAMMDITERRDVELAVQRQAELLEQTHDAVIVREPTGRVTYWNRGAEALYGYTREEAVGRSGHALLHSIPAAGDVADWDAALRRDGRWEGELHQVRSDGRRLLVESRQVVAPPQQGGTPLVLQTDRDITERRRTEEQLRRTERLQAVGKLAGGMAHEVNNMMTVVIGFGTFVQDALSEQHPLRRDVQEMLNAASRAATVTQQVLAYSRQQVLQPQVLDLSLVVRDLQPVLARLVGANVQLAVRLDPALPPIRADRGQLEQVLINLAANARDAMPEGGRLTIETTILSLDPAYLQAQGSTELAPGRYVMVVVSDTGTGMDAATLRRAFEPFFTTKAVGEGTGLGLAVVHGLVTQSGGDVWIYSEPKHGTAVKVVLPLYAEAGTGEPARESWGRIEPPVPPGTGDVLVVDDEPLVRAMARRSLEGHGFRVEEAADGLEAVARLAGGDTDYRLVLCDVVMPELSGKAVAQWLAEHRPEVPVLFMSGYTGQDVRERGLLPEGSAFVAKPFTPASLVRQVRHVLDLGATHRS